MSTGSYTYPCPQCGAHLSGPFNGCGACGYSFGHLVSPTSPEAQNKMADHTQLFTRGTISIGNKPDSNASFDYYGVTNLTDLVRFTITYGHRAQVSSGPGRTPSDVIAAFIPEIIGSGVSRYSTDYQPCSGLCIVSPASTKWGHPFPVLDKWVASKFAGQTATCFRCGIATPFAQPVCAKCYGELGQDWRNCL